MAHEKVFGICENKCKVEVVAKENVAIFNFEQNFKESGENQVVSGTLTLPDGFTAENSHIVSAKWMLNDQGKYIIATDNEFTGTGGEISIMLNDSKHIFYSFSCAYEAVTTDDKLKVSILVMRS